jgi:hypothetical protein
MAADLFGVKVLGRVMGVVLTGDGIAEATAPWLVGYLRDRSGSYDGAFIMLVATALLGAASVALLPSRRIATLDDTASLVTSPESHSNQPLATSTNH